MSCWKDENGAWVRETEQRFLAFAMGRIPLECFLDVGTSYVFVESDLSTSVVVCSPTRLERWLEERVPGL